MVYNSSTCHKLHILRRRPAHPNRLLHPPNLPPDDRNPPLRKHKPKPIKSSIIHKQEQKQLYIFPLKKQIDK